MAFELVEKVLIKPNSLIFYTQFENFINIDVGHSFTLSQNLNKSVKSSSGLKNITEFDQVSKFENLENTKFKNVTRWANYLNELHENKRIDLAKDNITLKELGTFSRAQIKRIKKITELYIHTIKNADPENYISFLTLTLPGTQIHSDKIIRKQLTKFLDLLNKSKNLQNYFWRAETQKNGNIHFHLLLDKWIDKVYIRNAWNRLLNELGYIDTYSEKFNKMTLSQYLDYSKALYKDKFDKEKATFAYNKGKKVNFKNPPTTKIETPKTLKGISAYVRKYLVKNEKDVRPIIGALWGASNRVKKLQYPSAFVNVIDFNKRHGSANLTSELSHLVENLDRYELDLSFIDVFIGDVWAKIKKGYKNLNNELKICLIANHDILNSKSENFIKKYI